MDSKFAEEVCAIFDKYKEFYEFEYFFDREAIKGSKDYLKKISVAIIESKIVLFLSSKNSTNGEFCSKELNFADKHNKPIYQYRIEEFELPCDIDLLLCNQHYRQASDFSIEEMVREVLSDVLECEIIDKTNSVSSSINPSPIVSQDISQPEPVSILESKQNPSNSDSPTLKDFAGGVAKTLLIASPLVAAAYAVKQIVNNAANASETSKKVYRVGDYYDDGIKQGVVFDVWDDGLHGKIVSLQQAKEQWAASQNFGSFFRPDCPNVIRVYCGAQNGEFNLHQIQQIDNWEKRYPAFAWCSSLGSGWYLPTINEMHVLLQDQVRGEVNKTLELYGAEKLAMESAAYWSSTENDKTSAWYVFGDCTYTHCSNTRKSIIYRVRAVATF